MRMLLFVSHTQGGAPNRSMPSQGSPSCQSLLRPVPGLLSEREINGEALLLQRDCHGGSLDDIQGHHSLQNLTSTFPNLYNLNRSAPPGS